MMSLSTHFSQNLSNTSSASLFALSLQGGSLDGSSSSQENSLIDYSVPGNRLSERAGYLEVIPKTPAEVFGERVLRPLLDMTYDWSLHSLRALQSAFYRFENIFSRAMNILPACQAQVVTRGQEQSPEMSREEAMQILKKGLGDDIIDRCSLGDDPASSGCAFDREFTNLMDLKQPNPYQRSEIKEAYDSLQSAADTDSLAICRRQITELLDEMDAHGDSYFIDVLRPLPKLLASLLDNSERDYTIGDLDDLVKKINQLSIKMLDRLQITSEETTLSNWVEVILKSAEKNRRLVPLTVEAIIPILLKENAVSREQERRLKTAIHAFRVGILSEEEREAIDKAIEITNPQLMVFRLVAGYWEALPGDIRKCDQHLSDAALEIYRSKLLRLLVLLGTSKIIFGKLPEKVRTSLFFLCWVLSLGQILSDFIGHPENEYFGTPA